MGNVKVSVLVPAYNVERYVRQCLESLAAQTYDNFEVVCLNDGSTDLTGDILHDFAENDARFRVVDKPNSGYGATMNRGIAESTGDFIAILESDDFAEPHMLETLARPARRRGVELVKANYYEYYDEQDHLLVNFRRLMCGRKFDPATKPEVIRSIPAIWTGLYSRRMIERENIRFRETPGASFQDTAFTLKCWFAARGCVLVRKPVMHYRMDNPQSSVKTNDKVFAVCDELADAEAFLRERPERLEAFIGQFHADKLGKCRWDYERLSPEHKVEFATRMRDEYRQANAAGELWHELYDAAQWKRLFELMAADDVAAFTAAHPKSLDE